MTGGYIRTNWRQTKSALDANAIGQGWALGSFAGGAGSPYPNGGFIMASINGSTGDLGGSTFFRMEALSAMNIFYGSNGAGAPLVGGTSGFKIAPIGAYFIGSHANSASACLIWASISTGDDSTMNFYFGQSTVSAGTSANVQGHFVWQGFIVSSP